MAARRAAATKVETPPPAPEPTPEPQPEPKEPEKPADEKQSYLADEERKDVKLTDILEDNVTERIIERIIICPGGQSHYMQTPTIVPPQGHCHCMQSVSPIDENRKKRRKTSKSTSFIGPDGLCRHPFCVAQREQSKPQGWLQTSGMYSNQNRPVSGNPNVMICQTPVLSCCPKCNPPNSDSSESEEEDPVKDDTVTYMTFMNMVFAAANIINERTGIP